MRYYITNNPLVAEKIESGNKVKIVFLESATYREILVYARDMIHKGHKLLTHPLTSSIKPNETPYKSVIVGEIGEISLMDLDILEQAIGVYDKFYANKKTPVYIQSVNEDFMLIDYDIIKN
ncbi:MAG: GrdX family protein [Lachnospirales bacterium]